jgi:hypothetical protein
VELTVGAVALREAATSSNRRGERLCVGCAEALGGPRPTLP